MSDVERMKLGRKIQREEQSTPWAFLHAGLRTPNFAASPMDSLEPPDLGPGAFGAVDIDVSVLVMSVLGFGVR